MGSGIRDEEGAAMRSSHHGMNALIVFALPPCCFQEEFVGGESLWSQEACGRIGAQCSDTKRRTLSRPPLRTTNSWRLSDRVVRTTEGAFSLLNALGCH